MLLFRHLVDEIQASVCFIFFFQAEDGIRDLVRSRGLGDVYKRQVHHQMGHMVGDAEGKAGECVHGCGM